MDSTLNDISRVASSAQTLEELARGLLTILGEVSRLDTVFITVVDPQMVHCEIAFVRNTQRQRMLVQEGAVVPWSESTCQSALAEGVRAVQLADERWEHLQVVHDLNICTYAMEPITDAGGQLLGTLCAVSARRLPLSDEVQQLMRMMSQLLAYRMGRNEPLPRGAVADADVPSPDVATDPLTGLTNRAGLAAETARLLTQAAREGGRVSVSYVDLVGFEVIDEASGHAAADDFLAQVAERLKRALQPHEILARVADREFVVVSLTPTAVVPGQAVPLHERLHAASAGTYVVDWGPLDYAGASVGTVDARVGDTAQSLLGRVGLAIASARPAEPHDSSGQGPTLPTKGRLASYDW